MRRECLQAVAMTMFEDDEGVQRSLGRFDAAEAVMPLLGCDRESALEFLEQEELNSGIVVCRSEGEIEFWHLTFQEYLAALELANDTETWWERIRSRIHDDRWAEVVLLLGGCKRRNGTRQAKQMIGRILETGTDRVSAARAVGLVGRILRDIRPYGGDPAQGTRFGEMLAQTLSLFEPGGEPVDETVRVEVGDALGQAGDPRLDDREANRIVVPGGRFFMGAQKQDPNGRGFDPDADDDEAPVREVALVDRAVRGPVTPDPSRSADTRPYAAPAGSPLEALLSYPHGHNNGHRTRCRSWSLAVATSP